MFKTTLGILFLLLSTLSPLLAQVNEASTASVRIAWDYSSMQKMADKGGYPRLTRLQDASLMLIYETRTGDIVYKRSYTNGSTWEQPVQVFSQFVYSNLQGEHTLVNMANPEIIQLQNGDLLVACNYRPVKSEIAPYSIVVRRSKDNGKTWLPCQVLYNAAPRFTDGCWEPSFLQLPDGELQVYFANENPYQQSAEQEISMISSPDNGQTWTLETKKVSFRTDRRDGMPVPLLLDDEIVVAIEDNYREAFKPYTVRTSVSGNWDTFVNGDAEKRNYALLSPVADSVYMGAPYLIRLPNGQTAISYQTTENRLADWQLSTMEVCIGDKDAYNFTHPTRPFPVSNDKEAKWNALAVWFGDTLVALTSSNLDGLNIAPWMIKGYLMPSSLWVSKDAVPDYSFFIGSKGDTNVRIAMKDDKGMIRITCDVSDATPSTKDGLGFYFAYKNATYRVDMSRQGEVYAWLRKKKKWLSIAPKELRREVEETAVGYKLHLSIPQNAFAGFLQKEFYFNVVLSAYQDEKIGYEETLVHADLEQPSTWIKVYLGSE